MEPTPVAPAPAPAPAPTPAKKSNVWMIVAIVVLAILSLCCCLPSVINLASPGVFHTSGAFGESTGNYGRWVGLICICPIVILWIVLIVVAIVRRPKKQ